MFVQEKNDFQRLEGKQAIEGGGGELQGREIKINAWADLHRQLKLADHAIPSNSFILTGVCLGCWTEQCRGEAISTDIV